MEGGACWFICLSQHWSVVLTEVISRNLKHADPAFGLTLGLGCALNPKDYSDETECTLKLKE